MGSLTLYRVERDARTARRAELDRSRKLHETEQTYTYANYAERLGYGDFVNFETTVVIEPGHDQLLTFITQRSLYQMPCKRSITGHYRSIQSRAAV